MDTYKIKYRIIGSKRNETSIVSIQAENQDKAIEIADSKDKNMGSIVWVEHIPAYPIGQAFRLLKVLKPLTPGARHTQPGYLVYRERNEYRGEDGRKFALSAVEDDRDWFWPVTKETIKKLQL